MDNKISTADAAVLNDTVFFSKYENNKSELDRLMHLWETAHEELEAFVNEYMTEK